MISTPLGSLPAWGVWIEITPRFVHVRPRASLPAWGVWIEILKGHGCLVAVIASLPAWGVWIEMLTVCHQETHEKRRSPHGECGLKLLPYEQYNYILTVAPRMGSVD